MIEDWKWCNFWYRRGSGGAHVVQRRSISVFIVVPPDTTMWRWRIWRRRPSWDVGVDRSPHRLLTLLKATSSGSTLSLMSTSPQSRDSVSATPSCLWYVHHYQSQGLSHIKTHKASTCFLWPTLKGTIKCDKIKQKKTLNQKISAKPSFLTLY